MRTRIGASSMVMTCLLLTTAMGRAQLAQSTFATGTDGWLSVTMPYPSAVPPTILNTFPPLWSPAGGGSLQMEDPDGTTSGNTEYWLAPASFGGDKRAAYGGTLAFDVGNLGGGYPPFVQEDLILVGGGLTLVATLPTPPPATLAHYDVPLVAGGWKRGGLTGPDATPQEFQAALAAVDQIFIRAEYQLGPDTEYLDNVVMSAGTSAADLPVRADFSLGPCTPNPFNPATAVTLDMARSAAARVQIVDASGRRVRLLCDATLEPGRHRLDWNGTDDKGTRVASGVYYCRAVVDGVVLNRGMVLIK